MNRTTSRLSLAFLGVGLFAIGTAAMAGTPEPAGEPVDTEAVILMADADSLLMRVEWSAAPRAHYYVVEIGDNAGTWTSSSTVMTLFAALWAPMTEVEVAAFACVTAWNRHPRFGDQEGGQLCADWTVPADLAPPGAPGDIQVFPDTAGMRIVALSPSGLSLPPLRSLGENAVELSYAFRTAAGRQYTCVILPDGREGLVESETVDGWRQRTVPSAEFWTFTGCATTPSSGNPDLVTVHWYPGTPALSLWPGETPVMLIEDPIIFFAHRNSVLED